MFSALILELEKVFDFLNKDTFHGELPSVCITVQHDKKSKSGKNNYTTLGWFNCGGTWQNDNEDKIYEITLTPDSLKGNYLDTIGTLVHEMVHLYCHIHDIEDCKGKKHTEDGFKPIAESAGLSVEKDKKVGWGMTYMTLELTNKIKGLNLDEDVFNIQYNPILIERPDKPKKPKEYYKCPGCGEVIKSKKKDLKLICGKCNEEFKYIIESCE